MKYELLPLSEIPPGEIRPALAGSTPVVVVRTHAGDVYALKDICPHRGPKLSGGTLETVVVGACPGQYQLSSDRYAIRCPWHQFEFDVTSGKCLGDPSMRVKGYAVTVENGTIYVER